MPAPIAKGIIIVASVLVAASIALYENPQVRNWVDTRRRKIAVALHSLGDEINPPQSSRDNGDLSGEQRRRRREEIIRRNRAELIRKAREEGIAVDLDELAAISKAEEERPRTKSRGSSFDDMVTSEGKLREEKTEQITAATSTAVEKPEEGLRHRTQVAGAAGLATGAAFANPFADEADVLFDQDDHEEIKQEPQESRESTATLQADTPALQAAAPLVNLSDASQPKHETQQHSSDLLIPLLALTEAAPSEASFHSFIEDREDEDVVRSTGTLTPTDASVVGNDDDIDIGALSETMSNASFSTFSETGYSEVGASTPGDWTDVGSDAGSEEEFGHASHQ